MAAVVLGRSLPTNTIVQKIEVTKTVGRWESPIDSVGAVLIWLSRPELLMPIPDKHWAGNHGQNVNSDFASAVRFGASAGTSESREHWVKPLKACVSVIGGCEPPQSRDQPCGVQALTFAELVFRLVFWRVMGYDSGLNLRTFRQG